jgi:hypothetical protein
MSSSLGKVQKAITDRLRSFSGQETKDNQERDDTKMKTTMADSSQPQSNSSTASDKKKKGKKAASTSTAASAGSKGIGTKVSKTQGADTDGTWICSLCDMAELDDKSMMMECEKCEKHFCLGCIDMSIDAYKYMCNEEVLWCCGQCVTEIRQIIGERKTDATHEDAPDTRFNQLDNSVMSMRKDLDETVGQMKELMETFHTFMTCEKKTKNTTNQTPNVEEAEAKENTIAEGPAPWGNKKTKIIPFREILREANEESRKEAEEEMERKKNVIIYRLPELLTDDRERRWETDRKGVNKFLQTIEVGVEIDKIARMGKRPELEEEQLEGAGQERAPPARPLKITLKNEEDAKKIFTNLYKLKNKEAEMSNLRITPDRSLQERENIKNLVETAKNLTRLEEGEYVHIVRGMKILRVKKRAKNNAPQKKDAGNPQ